MAISETRVLPPEFIEAAGKTYLEDLSTAVGGFKGADLSKAYGQQFVAAPGALQTQAESLAGGLGAYQPYLQTAAGLSGPTAYQQFMSPYQQDVISATLGEYDIQAQKGIRGIADQAIAAGAFGGGREGVQRAEYQAASDRNRAALQAQLLQQGFGQAQGLAQQNIANQLQLGQAQQGFLGQDVGALSTLGGINQAQNQAVLSAQQQLGQAQLHTTVINCTAIWFRNHGSNIRIPWRNSTNSSTYTRSITNWIKCRFNISWNIQSV
jgi:hypothetical protein